MLEMLFSAGVAFSGFATGAHAIRVASVPREPENVTWRGQSTQEICVSFATPFDDMQWGDTCDEMTDMKQYVQRGSRGDIVIRKWYGRTGNNLFQVAHAVFIAKLSGASRVTTPRSGSIRQIFKLPESFDVEFDSEFRTRVKCSDDRGHWHFGTKCVGVERADYTAVLRKHVLPYLTGEARGACQAEESNRKHELVIHLRSGDLLMSGTHVESRFAPCSFFHLLTEQNLGFEHVRVITEPDRKHPFLKYFVNNRMNITVQSSKVFAIDACALIHAKHLALGSISWFAKALSLFSPNQTVYNPYGSCRKSQNHSEEHVCPGAKRVDYCVPGLGQYRKYSDKVDWMFHYPKENISKVLEQCLQ